MRVMKKGYPQKPTSCHWHHDASGRKLVFADWLRTVGEIAKELSVYIRNSEKNLVPLKICACKKQKRK